MLQQCRVLPNILNCILFTDEAGFTGRAAFNNHNTRNWSDVHSCQEVRFQRRFFINVWAGIINDRLVGPYVLPNRLNAAQYLEFLNNVLEEERDVEVPLGERVRMWYLNDAYFAKPVTEWLNNHFPNRAKG